ncbi:MAG: hypothetical protein J6D06_01780 [Clostridia bacterium]|nr:hypothetical protein [Clostridia bacterium]
MKKALIIIIAIIVFALSVTAGFFIAKLNDNPPVETASPSTDILQTTEERVAESETVTEKETESETEAETESEASTTEVQKGDSITTDYYSVDVPASWNGKYSYSVTKNSENGGYGLSVCHKESYGVGYGGKLFTISLFSVEEGYGKDLIENEPVPLEYLGVLKVPGEGEFDVIVMFPSDAQFNESTMDGYNELFNSNESVYKTLTPTNGATFEKVQ